MLATLATGTAAPSSAWGCSCGQASASARELTAGADAVFVGTVTAVDDGVDLPLLERETPVTTLRVEKVRKGVLRLHVEVEARREEASCGVDFAVGNRYLVYAARDGAALETSLCAGTRMTASGVPPSSTGARSPLPIVAATAAVGLFATAALALALRWCRRARG